MYKKQQVERSPHRGNKTKAQPNRCNSTKDNRFAKKSNAGSGYPAKRGNRTQSSPAYAKIKKVAGLKLVNVTSISKRRMYRLSVIFGSTVLSSTFNINKVFGESVMDLRDKVLKSYNNLVALVGNDVKSTLLPRVVFDIKKRVDNSEDLFAAENKDVVDSIVNTAYSHEVKNNVLMFPSIVNVKIHPGKKITNVSSRVVIRLNLIAEPNFTPKKRK